VFGGRGVEALVELDFFAGAVGFLEPGFEGFGPAACDGFVEGFGAGLPADEVAVGRVGGVTDFAMGFPAG